ncbi:MAG: ATP-binding cassette domain-containing protein, partial [Oscillospiraceae bacterium]
MDIVEVKNLAHAYDDVTGEKRALNGITLTIRRGELVAVLGHNGCGKSTLARHINALLPVQSGELTVAGLNAKNAVNLWKTRRACGMVFQNPDNQFVSSVVEEDIAFGLENYDTPENEISEKVKRALSLVGMAGYEKKSPQMLSGGQKQRIAIAGVLAVDPDIIIFDEATSMLDPEGRQEGLATIRRLHDEAHNTFIMMSHFID